MAVQVTFRFKSTESRWGDLRHILEDGKRTIEAKVAKDVAADAKLRAPKDTGYMASKIEAQGSTVRVNCDYAGFVNYGTRYMMPEPFFTDAWKLVGVPRMKSLMRDLMRETGLPPHEAEFSEHGTKHPEGHAQDRGQKRPYKQQQAMMAAIREREARGHIPGYHYGGH